MYFVFNPFFYYVTHQDDIDKFVAIESDGQCPCLMRYSQLKPIVEKYVKSNVSGIDENNIEKYILYICDKLSKD
jgi:hypothetical protein